MKKVALLVVGLVICSVSLFAGEYLMNDTGATVYGLRVVFSKPVEITGFGDVLNTVEPAGELTEFVFSDGELGSWDGHWFNWEPELAQIISYEWLVEGVASPNAEVIGVDEGASLEAGSSWGSGPDALDFRYACIGQLCHEIFYDYPGTYRTEILAALQEIKTLGFKGASVNFTYFPSIPRSTLSFRAIHKGRVDMRGASLPTTG